MLYHIVIIAAYALSAIVIAQHLPTYFPSMDVTTSYWVGGAFFLVCALLHEFILRRIERASLNKQLKLIRRDLADAEGGLERIEQILGGIAGDDADMDAFATEMRMLRKLLNQLSSEMKKGKGGGTASLAENSNASGTLIRPSLVAEKYPESDNATVDRDAILEIV